MSEQKEKQTKQPEVENGVNCAEGGAEASAGIPVPGRPVPRFNFALSGSPNADDSPVDSPRSPRTKKTRDYSPGGSSAENSPRGPAAPFMVAASPPQFVVLDELMKAADGITNMALAHEIAVNADFSLEKHAPQPGGFEDRVRGAMERAYWDIMADKLGQDPPDHGPALMQMEEIRQTLLSLLLPQHTKLQVEISEVLDLDLIKQQVANGAIDYRRYATYVTEVLAKLCAPARDEVVAQLRSVDGVVPLFKKLMEVMAVMRVDMANFQIQQIRPLIQQQSAQYEKEKFGQFLKTQAELGIDGLEVTRGWLERGRAAAARAAETDTPPAPTAVLTQAFMELMDWDDTNEFPETVVLDVQRYFEVRYKAWHVSLLGAVLLVTYSTAGAALSGIAGFKETLKDHISVILKDLSIRAVEEKMPNVAEQVNKEVCECLEKHGYPGLSAGAQGTLKSQIQAVYSGDHAVRKLMDSRLRGFFRQCISSANGGRRDQLQVPPGMSAVSSELGACAGQFARLVNHNKAVFGGWYTEIITGVAPDQGIWAAGGSDKE